MPKSFNTRVAFCNNNSKLLIREERRGASLRKGSAHDPEAGYVPP